MRLLFSKLLVLMLSTSVTLADVSPSVPVLDSIHPTFVGPKQGLSFGQSEGIPGPYGNETNFVHGAINRILAHPTDPNILYVGAVNGGVWKTVEAQKSPSWNVTWTPLTDKFGLLAIGAMQFDYSDLSFNTFAAAVGASSSYHGASGLVNGVFITKDGGNTWDASKSDLFDEIRIRGIHIHGKKIVVCGVSQYSEVEAGSGTFVSVDRGALFKRVDSERCTDMVTDPSRPDVAYRAVPQLGIMQSLDSGSTWRTITDKSESHGWSSGRYKGKKLKNMRLTIWSNPERTVIYSGVLNDDLIDLLRGSYNTSARTWEWSSLPLPFTMEQDGLVGLNPGDDEEEEKRAGGQGSIHFSITVDKNDPDVIYIGGDRQPGSGGTPFFPNSIGARDFSGRLFRYRVGDPVAIPITHDYAHGSAPHADSRHLTMDASGNLLECDDGGIYRLTPNVTDGTQQWHSLGGNLAVLEAHSVAYTSGVFIVGNQDTGTAFGGPEGFWTSIQKGDGGVVRVAKSKSFTRIYASYYQLFDFGYFEWENETSYERVSTNNLVKQDGDSQDPVPFPTWCFGFNFYQSYTIHATNPNRLAIACPSSYKIIESVDGGNNWINLEPQEYLGYAGGFIDVIYGGKIDGKASPNVLVAIGHHALVGRGPSDASLSLLPGWTSSSFYGYAIAITSDRESYKRIWILLDSRQVVYTDDFGETFTQWGGNILTDEADIKDAKLLHVPGDHLFLYGRFGLLWLAPRQHHWVIVRGGVPNGFISDMGYDASEDMLYFSAMGRGIFALRDASTKLNGVTPPASPSPIAAPAGPPKARENAPVAVVGVSPTGGAVFNNPVNPPSLWSPSAPWIWIAVGGGAAILIIVIVVLSVILFRRRRKLSASSMSTMQSYAYAPVSDDESIRV